MLNSTYSLETDERERDVYLGFNCRTALSQGTGCSSQTAIPSVFAGEDDEEAPAQMILTNVREQVHQGAILDSDSDRMEVYLSVSWTGAKLGAALYECASCQIHVLPDTLDVPLEFHILRKVIIMTNPMTVIASIKQDDRFLEALRQTVAAIGARSEPETDSTSTMPGGTDILQLMPGVDFELGACRSRIMNLRLPGMPRFANETDKAIYVTSLLDMNNLATVKALGALLKYLDRKRINVELEAIGVKTPIVGISLFNLQDLVSIDSDTYTALQIFKNELHPSVYKLGNGTKEGLSLFGLFNQCKSTLGRNEMRLMFMRPTKDLRVLEQRHLAIAYFLTSEHMEIVASLRNCLKNIRNVSSIVAKMNGGVASFTDWQSLYKAVYNAVLIADISKLQPQRIEIFHDITTHFTPDLVEIASLISKIIDFDESAAQRRSVVKFGVNETLDEKKRTYNGLPDFMTKIARQELDRLGEEIRECNVIYLPQLGYLLSIPVTETMEASKDYEMPNLEFIFVSNNAVYYKSSYTRELDQLLGDIQSDIIDEEVQIMLRLQNTVLEYTDLLLDVLKYSTRLDCLLAMAVVAKEFNYIRPEMSRDSIIHIEQGRHPLQELCVPTFVANCTRSDGQQHGKVKLITGPNASGKSVYLKQVALIVFMAHIGSFVPAQSARIGLLDGLYSRIHTQDSISVGMSTFMLDLNQMALAARCANERSLIVIDEFGKGTSVVDGMALLASCLNFWMEQGEASPHVLVCTHIHGVTRWLSESRQLTYQTMEINQDGDEVVCLYRLVEGKSERSFAANVARKAGIPEDTIQRGIQVTKSISEFEPISPREDKAKQCQKRHTDIVSTFLQLDLSNARGMDDFLKSMTTEVNGNEGTRGKSTAQTPVQQR